MEKQLLKTIKGSCEQNGLSFNKVIKHINENEKLKEFVISKGSYADGYWEYYKNCMETISALEQGNYAKLHYSILPKDVLKYLLRHSLEAEFGKLGEIFLTKAKQAVKKTIGTKNAIDYFEKRNDCFLECAVTKNVNFK